MAAPTDVRVEAESLTTTRIRWTYPGANAIYVYRSTDNSIFTEVTTAATRVAVGTTEYEDVGLTAATKYYYKVSDDGGSTFSTPVVSTYTHACGTDVNGKGTEITLPRETEEQVSAETFNSLATVVEQGLVKFVSPDGRTCVACISDSALVIDCVDFDGCDDIEVLVDQDINSISLPNCADGDVSINFIIPPNATRKIGGWPRGIGFTGDEGFRAPVAGGSSGRSINEDIRRGFNLNTRSGKSKSGNATEGTNQGGASNSTGTCTCTPTADGGMRIVVCNPNGSANPTNSMNCAAAAASRGARLLVCGGRGPYTWSNTGSVVKSATTGGSITVTPPTNTGTAVAGFAYNVGKWHRCNGGNNQTHFGTYGCNDQLLNSGSTASNGAFLLAAPACDAFLTAAAFPIPIVDHSNPACSPTCDGCPNPTLDFASGNACDMRSAAMISNGCVPCGVSSPGVTVTVTDDTGAQVSVVMRI
jgi:hypothetical protein